MNQPHNSRHGRPGQTDEIPDDLDWTEMAQDAIGREDEAGDDEAFDDEDDAADLAALKARRLRLRVYADRLLEAVEAIAMPETFLEAERSARAVRCADAMLVQVYSPARRPVAAPSTGAAPAASRRASQSRYDDDDDNDNGEAALDAEARERAKFNDFMFRYCRRTLGVIKTRALMMDRLNHLIHDEAREKGVWPHGEPYAGEDFTYYACSVKIEPDMVDGVVVPPPADYVEMPGPDGWAKWIVHKTPWPRPQAP